MALKLTKDEINKRTELLQLLRTEWDAVEMAVGAYNAQCKELYGLVMTNVASYNKAVEQANEFAGEVHSRLQDEIGEKSDTWQQSEKGEAANAWVTEWEELSLEPYDTEDYDELVLDEPDHAADLANISDEPDVSF